MKNRFKLTTGFLIVSTAIFIIAAVVITNSARKNEEANLINVVSEQSNRDAQVIAGVVTGLAVSDEINSGIAAPEAQAGGLGGLALSTFLQSSNIVRLSLYDTEGEMLWSSVGAEPSAAVDSGAFQVAAQGMVATGLSKDVKYVSLDGKAATGDVTSTFLPLFDAVTNTPSQILEVSRDVTGTLDSRISSARTSMFTTVFGTLGGAFVVLFGVVLSADIVLGRSRRRAVSHERALADEKIVAHQLELENQQLKQLNEERDRFLSMVSHELRTPLASILGFADILKRRQGGESADKNQKHLDLIRRNGDHLDSLIEEMLEITRIEAGRFEVVKEGFELDQLLGQVSDSAAVMLSANSQDLVIDCDKDVELHGDRKRVMQVMLNLLSNASKYSPQGGSITLSTRLEGDEVTISVADQGDGIPETERQKLFDRFYRMDDDATKSQSGLGLGLSIVKAIVDAHHGAIDIQSEVGVGTTMSVKLPGARRAGAQSAAAITAEPALEKEIRRLERLRDLRLTPPRPAVVSADAS